MPYSTEKSVVIKINLSQKASGVRVQKLFSSSLTLLQKPKEELTLAKFFILVSIFMHDFLLTVI